MKTEGVRQRMRIPSAFLSQDHILGQLARFAMLTGVSAAMTVGLPALLHEVWQVPPREAAAIAFTVAFFVNFASMRRLVFRSQRGARRDLITYALSSFFFRLAEYAAFVLLTMVHIYYLVALVGVLAISAVTKFVWYRRVLHG